jgi:GNAT superfamily N-acetyltransferase
VTTGVEVPRTTVRRAGTDDVPRLVELRRAWSAEDTGEEIEADDDFLSSFRDWYEREQHQRVTWLAEIGARPVGMLNMLVFVRMPRPARASVGRPGRWGYIANVYVLPEHRNSGVGNLLLAAATTHSDEQGFARLVLSPSQRSIPFYRRSGFVPATSLMVRPGPD